MCSCGRSNTTSPTTAPDNSARHWRLVRQRGSDAIGGLGWASCVTVTSFKITAKSSGCRSSSATVTW
jgi:hypothetical protein